MVAAYIKEEEEEVCLSLVSEKHGELRKKRERERKKKATNLQAYKCDFESNKFMEQ